VARPRDRTQASDAPPSAQPLALSQGDPAGIGLDIAIAAWSLRQERRVPAFALFGDPGAVSGRARALGSPAPLAQIANAAEAPAAFAERLPVVPVSLAEPAVAGRPTAANAPAVIAAIEQATAAVVRGEAGALVTLPIAKSWLKGAGFGHPGHTEFLAELADRHYPPKRHFPVMMLVSEELRVVPLTIHVPLSAIFSLINVDRILATVRTMQRALVEAFGIASPRIAVAGLNPHAGEHGTMGREEEDVIAPAVAALRAEGLDVQGPLSADTLFRAEARNHYDAVLAMYHDQALIPLKTLAFEHGVNVTLGLPFVRTSPDHGTAFDIAGTGRASPESLIAALELASGMAVRRAYLHP
jgi:4-hydroxythreonine-4-phosphate dehydrogenase